MSAQSDCKVTKGGHKDVAHGTRVVACGNAQHMEDEECAILTRAWSRTRRTVGDAALLRASITHKTRSAHSDFRVTKGSHKDVAHACGHVW